MPHIDEDAKAWEVEQAARVGAAVQSRRKAVKMTAVQLSERTAQLGYPISRTAITKIETNARAGKLDVAELVVLAAALAVSPLQLLYPDLVDGPVKVFPNREAASTHAVAWFQGGLPINPAGDDIDEKYVESYIDGTTPLRLASVVDRTRASVSLLTNNADFRRTMGPGTEAFNDAMESLNNAKTEARRAGLVVDDNYG